MRKKLAFGLILFCAVCYGQHADFQWWPLINICVSKGNFKFFTEEQIRFRNSSSQLYVMYADVGVSYKLNSHVCLGPVYRPWWNKNGETFSQVNRFLFDINLADEKGKFEYSYRQRFQMLMRFSDNDPKEYFSRNKFEIRYNCRFPVVVSTELFIPLFKTTPNFVDKIRNTLGIEIPVSKHSAFIPLFMYIKDRSAKDYQDLFIFGGGYYLMF